MANSSMVLDRPVNTIVGCITKILKLINFISLYTIVIVSKLL